MAKAKKQTQSEAPAPENPPLMPPKPISAGAWRGLSRERFLMTLPSGATVKVRRVDIGVLVMSGMLTPEQVQDLAADTAPIEQKLDLARRVATYVVTEPVIVIEDDGDPEHMPMVDVPFADALTILMWAMGQTFQQNATAGLLGNMVQRVGD